MLGEIFTSSFIITSLAIFALVFVFKKVTNYYKISNHRLWKELVLPILPICLGLVMAMIDSFFGIRQLTYTVGLVAGLFSAHLYKIVKGALRPFLHQQNSISPSEKDKEKD